MGKFFGAFWWRWNGGGLVIVTLAAFAAADGDATGPGIGGVTLPWSRGQQCGGLMFPGTCSWRRAGRAPAVATENGVGGR